MVNIAVYAPEIYTDEREPFGIRKIGYQIYTRDGPSVSFRRNIVFENISPDTCMAIEYSYFYDYDIQHLYDLEHIWIYLNTKGMITGVEASFHGRYLNSILQKENLPQMHETHVIMYAQPGKHAMLPSPELFYLYPELRAACTKLAGIHGLDAPACFQDRFSLSEAENLKVAEYIKTHFSFEPSMHFIQTVLTEDQYMSWEQLADRIPDYLCQELRKILEDE